jgi:hydroxysqualene dehydroxylase
MKVAIIGAGWGGMACAVQLCRAGHQASVFEASRSIGGRARCLDGKLPDGTPVTLDNGQHILIGAYTECLALMQHVGLSASQTLLEMPLTLKFADGLGLEFSKLPTPLDALAAILQAKGWGWRDKASLLKAALRWQLAGFVCPAGLSVRELCQGITPKVRQELIEPLCISALNTPAEQASALVFLRVLKDALFGASGGSRLLLPTVDLGTLFPHSAARWVQQHGGEVLPGVRVTELKPNPTGWRVNQTDFDAVLLATSCSDAIKVLFQSSIYASEKIANDMRDWAAVAQALQHEAITTVYAWAAAARLSHPMLTLRSDGASAPAQFVFDRGQLGGPKGLLAFVVSASSTERLALQAQVLQQARNAMGLNLQAIQTVVEKRATFACTPALVRPSQAIAPGLLAVGDYVEGPYPATLEGSVRSAQRAVRTLVENQSNGKNTQPSPTL